jgi:hypothetical protein
MKKLTFIHSHDSTTGFLEEVIHSLWAKGYGDFEYFKINEEANGAESARNKIATIDHGSTIVFMGHGASHRIYLPYSGERTTGTLLQKDSFEILREKNFICLSCRSADFIQDNFNPGSGGAMIGFDDLPTHWQDVFSEREMGNWKAYPGITTNVLETFRQLLVEIFANALYDAVYKMMDFNQFYLRLRLYANRRMFQVTNYSTSDNPTLLANILYDFKNGTRLFGDGNAPILSPLSK